MSEATTTNKIILYSTDWCGYCRMAKQYFESKNIEFVEKNVESDPEARGELLRKIGGNFRGVPVIDIEGTIILGFDRPKIDGALATV